MSQTLKGTPGQYDGPMVDGLYNIGLHDHPSMIEDFQYFAPWESYNTPLAYGHKMKLVAELRKLDHLLPKNQVNWQSLPVDRYLIQIWASLPENA